ncbi:MAG: hypothetical protein NW208_02650 [Bryobacter sp.]|nr:hypothetical protein [Bryobacter sp.]
MPKKTPINKVHERYSGHMLHSVAPTAAPPSANANKQDIRWADVRSLLVRALDDHPEARARLVETLESHLRLTPETRIQL